jgi:hypothetical protein
MIAALACVSAGIAVAATSRSPSKPVPRVNPALRAEFRILRRAAAPGDALPATVMPAIREGRQLPPGPGQVRPRELGLQLSASRRALLGDRIQAWLVPGRSGMCWYARDRSRLVGGDCVKVRQVRPEQTVGSAVLYDNGLTIGLVTDDVLSIHEMTSPRAQRPLAIHGGFYVARYGARVVAQTAHGDHTLIPIPGLPAPS